MEIEAQIAEARADPLLDEESRTDIIEIYQDMLQHQPPLDNQENIRLVTQYYEQILVTMQE